MCSSDDEPSTATTAPDSYNATLSGIVDFGGQTVNFRISFDDTTTKPEKKDNLKVEVVEINADGTETKLETEAKTKEDGSFEVKAPPDKESLIIKVTKEDGTVKKAVVCGKTENNTTTYVPPVNEESDVEAEVYKEALKNGEKKEDMDIAKMKEFIPPAVAEAIKSGMKDVNGNDIKACVIPIIQDNIRKAKEIFKKTLVDSGMTKDIEGKDVAEPITFEKIKQAQDEIKKLRKELDKKLYEIKKQYTTKEEIEAAEKKAFEEYKFQEKEIFNKYGIPPEILMKADQIAHDTIFNGLMVPCNCVPEELKHKMVVFMMMKKANETVITIANILINVFGLDKETVKNKVKNAFEVLKSTFEKIDFKADKDAVKKAMRDALAAFVGSTIGNIKDLIPDTITTDKNIDDIIAGIINALEAQRKCIDTAMGSLPKDGTKVDADGDGIDDNMAIVESQVKLCYETFRVEVVKVAEQYLSIKTITNEEEKKKKKMLIEIIMIALNLKI